MSGHEKNFMRLVLVPSIISVCVTLLRLAGELGHWSERWFSTETGGCIPSGVMSWVVGIRWLPIPFGAYFAVKLLRDGYGPAKLGRAMPYALLGLIVLI